MLSIDLSSKVALITGASRGIGRGIARIYAQCGAKVAVNFVRSKKDAWEIVEEIKKTGGDAFAVQGNVSNPREAQEICEQVVNELGKIDILVNNAGITSRMNIEDLSFEEIERTFKVNILGSFYCVKGVLPYMLSSQGGVIINIASTGAYTGGGGGPHYAASKAAMIGFTRNLARYLGPKGIRTNVIAPTLIETDFLKDLYPGKEDQEKLIMQVPLRRLGKPEDVGHLAAFLASDLGGFINGQIIVMDGGRTFN
ncbi:MAG: 3-oxoacyl-ACP reductase FabG [Clostridia bacterium]|nr:3-oxoacyl-ACP reductase FabG [Clostridia bacterium]